MQNIYHLVKSIGMSSFHTTLAEIETEMIKYSDTPEIIQRLDNEDLHTFYDEVLFWRFNREPIDQDIGH